MGFNTFPCNPYPISTEELHKGDNEELQAQIDAIKDGSEIDSFGDVETALGVVTEAITGLGTSKAAKADIAPTFSAEGTYAVGDLVYYEGVLYKCTTAHEEAAWDAEDFTVTSVVEEVCAINSNIASKVGYRTYYAEAEAETYSIPITRAAAYIIAVNIPTGANSANPGLYYVVKQGNSVSKSDLITDVLGLTVTISDSNLVLAWTVQNPYGANFTVIPVMEFT